MAEKNIVRSRTFWVNLLAVIGMGFQSATGTSVMIEPEAQATLLAAVNIVLRLVTKDAVWIL